MKFWQSSGWWTSALAFAHVATTTVFYGDSWHSLVDAGLVNALDSDPALATLRGAAFWYVTSGVTLALFGLMVLVHERQHGAPPRGFATVMAVTGVWGVVLSPASPFWLFLLIGWLAAHNVSKRRETAGTPVWDQPLSTVELRAGLVEYVDTGGDGPTLLFTHGFPMTHTQWRKVIPSLDGFRCVAPTLPLGGHRFPMRAGTDLSQVGQARILADFMEALDLRDVTLVMNDWGGPQLMISEGRGDRVGALVLASCEAFDNFPPRPARPLIGLLRIPGGAAVLMRLLRLRFFRHNRRAFGGLTEVGVPDEVLDEWFAAASRDPLVRRDLTAFATTTPSRDELMERSEQLSGFGGPVLVVWGSQDRMMPRAHAVRLATLFEDSRLELIEGSGTLIPEDRPEAFVAVLKDFLDARVTVG